MGKLQFFLGQCHLVTVKKIKVQRAGGMVRMFPGPTKGLLKRLKLLQENDGLQSGLQFNNSIEKGG
jgi:hypothetical protein